MPLERLSQSLLIRHDDTDALCVIPSGSAAERKIVYACIAATVQPVLVFQDRLPTSARGRVLDPPGRPCRRRDHCPPPDRAGCPAPADAGSRAYLARHGGARTRHAGGDRGICRRCELRRGPVRQRGHGGHAARFGRVDRAARQAGCDPGRQRPHGNRRHEIPAGARRPGARGRGGHRLQRLRVLAIATPTLTTVRSPAYEMGERGAELLLERLAGERFSCRNLVLDVSLQVGQSD